jgi:hypothetical protein
MGMSFPLRNKAPTAKSGVFEARMKACLARGLVILGAIVAGPLRAGEAEDWVAKARAYLGTESALNAVHSVHYTGTVDTVERVASATDKTKVEERPAHLSIDLVFQKPFQQLTTIHWTKFTQVSGLDDYEAWQKRISSDDPAQWQVDLLDGPQVKRQRANAWENLNFFADVERKGGSVRYEGEVTVDGVACGKLSFVHEDDIVFRRYFEKSTGRLIKTETDTGAEIREEGEIVVGGIRFPKKIVNKASNGQVTTIAFDQVILNERFPAADFAVPAMSSN